MRGKPMYLRRLEPLTDREKQIIQARGTGQKLADIGLGLGISGERVRQIELRGRSKIRWQAALAAEEPSADQMWMRELAAENGWKPTP